ncbi:vitamin B12-dependent ribonucleotide reductase [Gluconacetobacter diazotrophicus]|uniref:ribonucleoside-diphosphate reductase n=1 Tax=Gluconacetobacter diazotrophicus TaxID=33996 RepID=A0A7W4I4R4_GLUDI|nr:vitamin B12-dependent ribonucleotide reductase [Gluconacetobacter diazotrophicus]MBB2156169.1 vitamin B12-dependent ribonucleotide reductase [Gluconacetobacter diazotrophicus]
MVMTARSHWNGVRMRTTQAAADPDDALRAVTLPVDWDDEAAAALARMAPGRGTVRLAAEAARWVDDLAVGPLAAQARSLSCLLMMRQAAPTESLWTGQHDRRPGFIVNLAGFVQPGSGFLADDFVAALRLMCLVLRDAAERKAALRNGELPFLDLPPPAPPTGGKAKARAAGARAGTKTGTGPDPRQSDLPQPPLVAGNLLLTNLDACLAALGLDYDSETARDVACSLASLATSVAHAGGGVDSLLLPPARSVVPGLAEAARAVWRDAAVETDTVLPRIETGFSAPGPIDALLGVEACGLAPIFSPLRPDGRLAASTLARLAWRGLTPESAFAAALAGETVLRLPDTQAHQAMHRAVAGFVDRMPARPDATAVPLRARLALERGARRNLPARHGGFTQKASVGGHRLFLRTGEYEDGTLGEVAITPAREGPMARGLMDALGQAVSIGLQYGAPLDAYVDAFAYTRFGPAGTVEGDSVASYATSLLDYAFRALSDAYLGHRLPDAPHQDDIADAPSPMLPLDFPAAPDGRASGGRRGGRLRLVG